MAACLEGHRDDVPAGVGLETPSEADVQRSEAVLNLFDRLEVAGEVPTASTYAFALKVWSNYGVCLRRNCRERSEIRSPCLD